MRCGRRILRGLWRKILRDPWPAKNIERFCKKHRLGAAHEGHESPLGVFCGVLEMVRAAQNNNYRK